MTETQQPTLPSTGGDSAENAGSAETSTTAPAAAGDTRRPAAKRGSLSAKLLPELQQIAGGLGINTSKMKKSDLIAAIQAKQGGGAPQNGGSAGAPPPDTAAASGAPADSAASASSDTAAPERRRARGSRGQGGGGRDAGEQAPDSQNSDGTPPESKQHHQDGGQNNQGSQNSRGNNQNDQNEQNNRGNNQNDQNNQGGGQNQGNNQGGGNRNDDDYDGGGGGRRRGRRYRDRRGRNRDRQGGGQGGGQGGNDAEPTVTDDDVLLPVAGVVDCIEEKNNWFVRVGGYFASSDDLFVSNSLVRKFGLRRGDAITGAVRQPRDGERREKYNPLVRIDTVNGDQPDKAKGRVEFTKLTPLYPQERLRLETEAHLLTTRVIDLVMPIGKGQRALIVSPPKAGKTMVLQSIANAITTNNPEVHLMVVLVDERPEEVTDMQRSVKGEVIASTFDRRPHDHTTVAELSIERAKRLVEMGHDVVVLLDSITRLGRAYNLAAPASGRILSGGVDSTALYPPKRFLGAARNIENGGSLTILATALVETGSAGDTVIFEEFKGTGNAELKLDRKIADKRVFPAVDVDQSSTRKEELLLSPDELAVTIKLRRVLHSLEPQQAIDLLLDRLRKTRNNYEFLMNIAKTTPGQE